MNKSDHFYFVMRLRNGKIFGEIEATTKSEIDVDLLLSMLQEFQTHQENEIKQRHKTSIRNKNH